MDTQKQKEQQNQPRREYGNPPGQQQPPKTQPGHQGNIPQHGQDPNQPRREHEQQPIKK